MLSSSWDLEEFMSDSSSQWPESGDDLDDADSSPSIIPPVAVVVVTYDSGPWLDELLANIASQDYPAITSVILDASPVPVDPQRIAQVLPGAFVARLDQDQGFAGNVNEALGMIEGATYLILAHDDVRPATSAVRLMVEEALRSNAGIVAPKYVRWDDPERIISVGLNVDKLGARADRVVPGELDQRQHDAVRDVFIAPGGFVLLRMDLFATLGGMDPSIEMFGEDLDICWRAMLLGARVIVAPQAQVAHIEITRSLTQANPRVTSKEDILYLIRRNELWTILKCYSTPHLFRILPQALMTSIGEILVSLIAGKFTRARSVIRAWSSVYLRRHDLIKKRREIQSGRIIPDREIRDFQVGGYVRVSSLMHRVVASYQGVHRLSLHGIEGEDHVFELEQGEEPEFLSEAATGSHHTGEISVTFDPIQPEISDIDYGNLSNPEGVYKKSTTSLNLSGADASDDQQEFDVPVGTRVKLLPDSEPIVRLFGLWKLSAPSLTAFLWVILIVVLLVGERHWISAGLPVIGQLSRFTTPWNMFGRYFSTNIGLPGFHAPVSFAVPAIGISSIVTFASGVVVEKLLVLGAIVCGAWGVTRFAKHFRRSLLVNVATVIYVIIPLPYNLFSEGRLLDLLVYSSAPWLYYWVACQCGIPPFVRPKGRSEVRSLLGFVLGMSVGLALTPALGFVAIIIALSFLGSLIFETGKKRSWNVIEGVIKTFLGVIVASLVNFPTFLAKIESGHLFTGILGPGSPSGSAYGASDLVRFHIGPLGSGWLGYLLILGMVVPLAFGRAWRFNWAIRSWTLFLVALLLAWLGAHEFMGFPSIDVGSLLVLAALALAIGSGIGSSAYEVDLVETRFGWRQGLSILAGVSIVLSMFPVLAFMSGGQMGLASGGWETVLGGTNQTISRPGTGNTLWIGNPKSIPLDTAVYSSGVSFGVSRYGIPTVTDQFQYMNVSLQDKIEVNLGQLRRGLTADFGTQMARLGIEYIDEPLNFGPSGQTGVSPRFMAASWVSRALDGQTDLKKIQLDPSLNSYETPWKGNLGSGKAKLIPNLWIIEQVIQIALFALLATGFLFMVTVQRRQRGKITTSSPTT